MKTGMGLFLRLFDRASMRALKLMMVISTGLALLDFATLVVLYPVFSALISGDARGDALVPALGSWTPTALVMLAMAMLIARSAGEFASRVWWARKAGTAEVRLSSRLLRAYAYAPYSFHLTRNSSELMSRAVSQVNMATTSGLNGIANIGADMALLLATATALLFMNPFASLAAFAYVGAVGLTFSILSRKVVRTQTERQARHVGQVYARASTVLRGIRELTVADGRGPALESIAHSRTEMVHAQQRLIIVGELPRMALEVALYLAMLGTLVFVLGSEDAQGALPTIALFVFAAMRILPAVGRSLRTLTSVRAAVELGKALGAELTDVELRTLQVKSPSGLLPPRGNLTMDNIDFTYHKAGFALRSISLEVPFGSTLGIVGPSGSGKSTLLSLLLGLLPPDSGTITYGGASIGVGDAQWLRQVGYVPQEVFVLDDSVAANVALGDASPDGQRVRRALERAHLWDVVEAMPLGIETSLGEDGSRLSVGQKQRLGIARALYRRAHVLIMDEPTASLDPESEQKVVQTLESLRGEVSSIIVSHRLAPLAIADQVIRFESGTILGEEQLQ